MLVVYVLGVVVLGAMLIAFLNNQTCVLKHDWYFVHLREFDECVKTGTIRSTEWIRKCRVCGKMESGRFHGFSGISVEDMNK